jgi:hypothetical protein
MHVLNARLLDPKDEVDVLGELGDDLGAGLESATPQEQTYRGIGRVREAAAGAGLDLDARLVGQGRDGLGSERGAALPHAAGVLAADAEGGEGAGHGEGEAAAEGAEGEGGGWADHDGQEVIMSSCRFEGGCGALSDEQDELRVRGRES